MADEIEDAIEEAATDGVKRARTDAGEVEAHPIKDQIEADRYLASKAAARNTRRGLRITRLVPPGAAE